MSLRIRRRQTRCWAAALLPGLFLRSLIPLGFMPMFGPGFSVGVTLCPAYAPIPDMASSGSSVRGSDQATADSSMGMPGMDISMDMPMSGAKSEPTATPTRTTTGDSIPIPDGSGSGSGPDHQTNSLYHYLAHSIVAALPMWLGLVTAEQPPGTTLPLPAPQVAYFQVSPRSQLARAPPDPQI